MRLKEIHLYWLLIAIPTLVLGMAAVRMLNGEQARMRALASRADTERAERLAETVRSLVVAVQHDVMALLEAMPVAGQEAALLDWMRRDPRVRNGFVWSPQAGVIVPALRGATQDERRFLQRYAPLFLGEAPWMQTHGPHDKGLADAPASGSPERQATRELAQLRGKTPAAPAASDSAAEPSAEGPGRWRTWFEGNQLYLLGWQRLADGTIRGVELETVAILSRLPAIFESLRAPDAAYALRNGEDLTVVQVGEEVAVSRIPDARVSLAPELPHWEIAYYRLNGAAAAGRRFLLMAWLLLTLVLASLVAGGLLLMRDAAAQRRDALQKTNFVSSVSHELKTPLTSIRLYAELLRDGRVDDVQKKGKFLDVIVTESERLTRLVNNVLDFSRMEQGRRRFAMESIELRSVLREVAEAQRGRIEATGMRLVLDMGEAEVALPADRDAVGQIVVNLLDNAVKYAPAGGEVLVGLRPAADGAEVTVQDRGPGIAEAHRVRLFESFYRVDCELTAKCNGCGLGLSIARRLMRGMGGDVTFAPRDGGGSCFTLHFVNPRAGGTQG